MSCAIALSIVASVEVFMLVMIIKIMAMMSALMMEIAEIAAK